MTKQSAESFVADDLFVVRKRLVDDRPGLCERPVLQRLVRRQLVVVVQVRSDQIVKVLLAENDEEIQTLGFYRLRETHSVWERPRFWKPDQSDCVIKLIRDEFSAL